MALVVDLVNQVISVAGIVPQVIAATAQGSSQDLSNGEISTNMIVSVGAYGANTTNCVVRLEESEDGSSGWTAISGMAVTATTSNTHTVVMGQRSKRYVRANAVTVQGTTPSIALAVEIVAQKKYVAASASLQGGYSRSPST